MYNYKNNVNLHARKNTPFQPIYATNWVKICFRKGVDNEIEMFSFYQSYRYMSFFDFHFDSVF